MSYFKRILQEVKADTNNGSTTNITTTTPFVGVATSTLGIAGIQVSLKTDQNCHLYVQQAPYISLVQGKGTVAANNSTTLTGTGTEFTRELSIGDTIVFDQAGTNQTRIISSITSDTVLIVTDAFTGGSLSGKTCHHYPWDISDEFDYLASKNNFGVTVQAINSYVRVKVINIGNATTDYFRLQTALCPIVEVLPRSLDAEGQNLKVHTYGISDQYNYSVENTPMGEMRVVIPTKVTGSAFDGPTVDTNYWVSYVANNGSVTQGNATSEIRTNTTANGTALLMSKRKAKYSAGTSQTFRTIMLLPDTGTANNKRRWGIGIVANYNITISSATVVAGDIYSNNGQQFTVRVSGTVTTLKAEGSGDPGAGAQTYTLVAGTGPATLTGSAFALAATVTDGALFQLDSTTFSIVILKQGVETVVSSGTFNGDIGATYTVTTNITTYEIYWTNSGVLFVIGDLKLHYFTGSTSVWTSSMNQRIIFDNVNSGGSISDVLMYVRVASIRRLGPLLTQPTSYYYASGTTTGINLKLGPGNLHSVIFGSAANNAVVTLSDNVSGTGNALWVYTATGALAAPVSIDFKGLPFHNGLRLTVSTGNASCTVVYE